MKVAHELTGRTAIVTGGGSGIGRAIAYRFAEAGARVAICGRQRAPLETAAAEIARRGGAARTSVVDLREPVAVREFVATVAAAWGAIDIVVNNAGVGGRTPLRGETGPGGELDERDRLWRDILATNLDAVWHLTRAALPHMAGPRGRVINISSVLGRFGVPGYAAYCTAKHGIIGFTRALALELAPEHITVNAIAPGWVSTEMATQSMRAQAESAGITFEEFLARAMLGVPLGRMIEPPEVAELALYLASEAAAGMTGQTLNLCGGQTMA
jgi:ketoreductase